MDKGITDQLRQEVGSGKKVRFHHFKGSSLFYQTESGLMIQIPIEATGTGTFNAEETALSFMKFIREQLLRNQMGMKAMTTEEAIAQDLRVCVTEPDVYEVWHFHHIGWGMWALQKKLLLLAMKAEELTPQETEVTEEDYLHELAIFLDGTWRLLV